MLSFISMSLSFSVRVCRYTLPPPPSTFFHCLFMLNQRESFAFMHTPYIQPYPNAINFWGRLLSLFNIQQRILFPEYTRINACSYCLCTLRLRSAYITQCDCDANNKSNSSSSDSIASIWYGSAAFIYILYSVQHTIITSENTRCIYFDVQYEMKYNTKRCKWIRFDIEFKTW